MDTQESGGAAATCAVIVVERDLGLSLAELSAACACEMGFIEALVDEGVLTPAGAGPQSWCFTGASLARARVASRLAQDLHVNVPGVALALELIDEIAVLRARLRG
ncbi:chaperone modulatory protein CbpM [Pelomonas saccharophila]|uniref:Chaperone modulatory protein CbpM n=1 Tax=Roseateles saccharophilus TaxID=304 RepID=A0ABU1YPU5_ROSSA|nr:chaperone modulator CbpM [Roseateles saccharophilus]MDR7270231.1 chaperone modulatory protein CbpM [Roseateles saccharophilus]